jgi:hypothetical protein
MVAEITGGAYNIIKGFEKEINILYEGSHNGGGAPPESGSSPGF